jgi:hypothetical protein
MIESVLGVPRTASVRAPAKHVLMPHALMPHALMPHALVPHVLMPHVPTLYVPIHSLLLDSCKDWSGGGRLCC